jgi:hypothetical protein
MEDLPANTPDQYPGFNGVAHHSEGVFVGYRNYDAQNIDPLFAFGHGLSFTSFFYDNLVITPVACPEHPDQAFSVELDVTNAGNYPGGEAIQLYVGMPSTDDVPQPAAARTVEAFSEGAPEPGRDGSCAVPAGRALVLVLGRDQPRLGGRTRHASNRDRIVFETSDSGVRFPCNCTTARGSKAGFLSRRIHLGGTWVFE